MSLDKWANQKMKKLVWTDISFIKISVGAFTLMLAKLWPIILALDWYWYLIICLIFMVKPYYHIFSRIFD